MDVGGIFNSTAIHATGATDLMPIVITATLLIAALWVILSRKYAPTEKHWAYGVIGTIVGFWLHT
jgi:hypothetical protein